MALFPFLYFLMLGREAAAEAELPPLNPMRLRFIVADDRRAQKILAELEDKGEVLEMRDFDGTNLEVIWRPDTVEQAENALRMAALSAEIKGVQIVHAEVLRLA